MLPNRSLNYLFCKKTTNKLNTKCISRSMHKSHYLSWFEYKPIDSFVRPTQRPIFCRMAICKRSTLIIIIEHKTRLWQTILFTLTNIRPPRNVLFGLRTVPILHQSVLWIESFQKVRRCWWLSRIHHSMHASNQLFAFPCVYLIVSINDARNVCAVHILRHAFAINLDTCVLSLSRADWMYPSHPQTAPRHSQPPAFARSIRCFLRIYCISMRCVCIFIFQFQCRRATRSFPQSAKLKTGEENRANAVPIWFSFIYLYLLLLHISLSLSLV